MIYKSSLSFYVFKIKNNNESEMIARYYREPILIKNSGSMLLLTRKEFEPRNLRGEVWGYFAWERNLSQMTR